MSKRDELMRKTLDAFIASPLFKEGVVKATMASYSGSGYSVELYSNGHYYLGWDNFIGNLYVSDGLILPLPVLDDVESDSNFAESTFTLEDELGDQFDNVAPELAQELLDTYEPF